MTQRLTDPIRPSTKWYWIGGAVAVIGGLLSTVGGILWFATGFDDFGFSSDGLDQLVAVPAHGDAELEADVAGTYYIYVESDSDDSFDDVVLSPADVEVEAVGGGEPIAVGPAQDRVRYTRSFATGSAQLQFDVAEPGTYRVTADAFTAGGGVLYAGPELEEPGFNFGGDSIAAFAAMFIGSNIFLVGKVILIVVAVKRSSEQTRRRRIALLPPPPSEEVRP